MSTALSDVRWHFEAAMRSRAGAAREGNEDSAAFVLPKEGDPAYGRGALMVVADGMGGHAAGEVASRLATETVVRDYYASTEAPCDALVASFHAANETVYAQACEDLGHQGMGTTCIALVVCAGRAYLASVGDSRAYMLRSNALHQLSEDDTLVMELVRSGAIDGPDAIHHQQRNVLVRAIGTHPRLSFSVWREGLALFADDLFVLCSDGLTDVLEEAAIQETIRDVPPATGCAALMEKAIEAGAQDDITVGILAVANDRPIVSRLAPVTKVGVSGGQLR